MSEEESYEERLERQKKKREEMMKKRKGTYRPSCYEEYRFSTGIYPLDKATGGIPCGRTMEIFGPESSAKTSTAIKISGEINKINRDTGKLDLTYSNPCSTLFVDMQNTFSVSWAEKLGFKSTDYGNSVDFIAAGDIACDVIKDLIAEDLYSLIVVDSTEEFSPLEVNEGDIGVNDMGLKAKTLARTCRRFTLATAAAYARNKGCPWKVPSILFLSPGTKIFMDQYGRYESDAGNKLRFACTLRMFMSKLKIQEEGSKDFGKASLKATVKKNKLGAPGFVAEYMMALQDLEHLSTGEIDNVSAILTDAKDLELINKIKGGYEFLGQEYSTQKELKERMYTDIPYQKEIWSTVMKKIGRQGLDYNAHEIEE